MRSLIISVSLLALLSIFIISNAYFINSMSTELLDIIYSLPSDYNYIKNLDTAEFENYKAKINQIVDKWEKKAFRVSLVTKYTDFERVNLGVYSLRDYFFTEYFEDYILTRDKLIIALEKQKQNELANLENIL